MNSNSINSAVKEVSSADYSLSTRQFLKTNPEETAKDRTSQSNNGKNDQTTLSVKDAKELTLEMNEIMDDLQTSLGFSIREDLNHQVVVEIKDRETNELIKQIPSEELLEIKLKMEEFTGLILDHRA